MGRSEVGDLAYSNQELLLPVLTSSKNTTASARLKLLPNHSFFPNLRESIDMEGTFFASKLKT